MSKDIFAEKSNNHSKNKKNKKVNEWKLYRGKIQNTAFRIFLLLTISVILIGFIVGLNFYRNTLIKYDEENIKNIEKYIKVIEGEISKTSNNYNLAKKHSKRWNEATENQKNNEGIKSQVIDDIIKVLSQNYLIFDMNYKISIPKKVENKTFLEIYNSFCELRFRISDDAKLYSFMDDLFSQLPGYYVINELTMSKNKKYEYQDLLEISRGKSSGLIMVSLKFNWLVTKAK